MPAEASFGRGIPLDILISDKLSDMCVSNNINSRIDMARGPPAGVVFPLRRMVVQPVLVTTQIYRLNKWRSTIQSFAITFEEEVMSVSRDMESITADLP